MADTKLFDCDEKEAIGHLEGMNDAEPAHDSDGQRVYGCIKDIIIGIPYVRHCLDGQDE